MYWPRLSTQQVKKSIFDALAKNQNYRSEKIIGLPATFLDTEVFYDDAPFLKQAPFLSVLIANPNHIGCHTLPGEKEPVFKGTQEIEKDLIRICAEEIFAAEPDAYDGYVASGGTEANIEALWIYRNYFTKEKKVAADQIRLVYSADSHYSFPKAGDLLGIQSIVIDVNEEDRSLEIADLKQKIEEAKNDGAKYFIISLNLGTTMFGSVDDIDAVTDTLEQTKTEFKLHIDAAYGGFMYPFVAESSHFTFKNPNISSFTIDGHKLLQAPYGTGIFLVRKNMIEYVCTDQAKYVAGKDYTLIGSRSGANAACVWMILHIHGSKGWTLKMEQLLDKTTSLCAALDDLGVEYYRHTQFNIVTIKSKYIAPSLAQAYTLVPDNHEDPKWYKIVVMAHVRQGVLDNFVSALAAAKK